MKWLAALLMLVQLPAVELPTITRADSMVLAYDLGATAPWMPLLWERCTLTLPAGTSRVQIIARMVRTGFSADDSDLLALRDGHRVTITGSGFTVAGLAGTWNGVCIGSTGLIATIDQAISAADLLLLCRQLHYANLGGERTLARRRVELFIHAFAGGVWVDSLPLFIDVDPVAADQPPKVRFDAQAIPLGGAVDWRPIAWYDGRQTASQLTWRIQTLPAFLAVTGTADGARTDQTAELTATPRSLDWFAAAQLQLQAGGTMSDGTAAILVSDGSTSAASVFAVAVVPASGELEVVGDFPFSVQASALVPMRASRPDVRFVNCIAHPATGLSYQVTQPFTVFTGNGEILFWFDRLPMGQDVIEGCAVFEAGGSTFRLPYRIAVLPGMAN